jgi:hypothetical protein
MLQRAAIALYENDLSEAEPPLDAVLAADPQNARASALLAEVRRRREEAARRTTMAGDEALAPFVVADPLPVVRVTANGVTANFVVDTGADVTLEASFARRLGLTTVSAGNGIFAGGLHAPMQRGTLRSLALGGATAYDVPVHVLATQVSTLFGSLRIDGVVGTTYFERFLVTIDFPHRQLILRPRSREVSAAFEARQAAGQATIVPCYLVGDHFVFAPAQVNDAAPGLFLFDSGLAGGGLMPSAALVKDASIRIDPKTASTGIGGGGSVTAIPFVARRVAVGNAVQADVPGIFTPQGDPFGIFPFAVWGAISNDFLKHYAYTVDFDAMKIVLAPPATSAPAPALPPGQRIFDAAFRRLQSYPIPDYAVSTDTWHIRQTPMGYYTGSASSIETHRYAFRLSDGMENVSDPSLNGKLPPAFILPEFLGPFAWSLRSSVRIPPPGGLSMRPDIEGFKTIATVVAYAKPSYAIATSSDEMPPVEDVNGHQTYHLRLQPRGDAAKHNLRDLWIDTQTHDLWKAHFVGTYAPIPKAPTSPTDVTVYFKPVLGCWVVAHALWNYDDPPVRFEFDLQVDELALPDTLPGWLFDDAAYRRHEQAGEPDYIGLLLDRMRRGGG